MLETQVVTATTPYHRTPLPTPDDITRILSYSDKSYIAKRRTKSVSKGANSMVAKTIRESTRSYTEFDRGYGYVRARKSIGVSDSWLVEHTAEAGHLRDFQH